MELWENYSETLKRELSEELWDNFEYEVLEKSNWRIVYDWPEELQKRKWFLGQVRTSFWVIALNNNIKIQEEELRVYKWVSDIKEALLSSWFPIDEYEKFESDWNIIQNKYKILFE